MKCSIKPDFELVHERLFNQRAHIITTFETFENMHQFEHKSWPYKHAGGGTIGLLRGHVFEKGAVNISNISGPNFPMNDASGPFNACGISLITHMLNPFVPTAHFNVRLISLEDRYWIGGGFDLTPMADIETIDVMHFHAEAKKICDRYELGLYEKLKKNADEYFYIPHRQKTRGVGGIFFDHFSFGDIEKDLCFLEDISQGFLNAYVPIITKYKDKSYTQQDKDHQNKLRAHYVEFNLLYDRGTRFGFLSGGNPEAILCSMPPTAKW
jgi:coproporphyrinogen III oxidase